MNKANSSDAARAAPAVDLKIGAIVLGQAYDDFTGRWEERSFLSNWREYRLSANRVILNVLAALGPVDQLQASAPQTARRGVSSRS